MTLSNDSYTFSASRTHLESLPSYRHASPVFRWTLPAVAVHHRSGPSRENFGR